MHLLRNKAPEALSRPPWLGGRSPRATTPPVAHFECGGPTPAQHARQKHSTQRWRRIGEPEVESTYNTYPKTPENLYIAKVIQVQRLANTPTALTNYSAGSSLARAGAGVLP